MKKEGHIVKLSKCDEDCFISPTVITRKEDGSIKLALDSKLLNGQIFKNKYQMPNIHELIDNIALQLSNKHSGEVWFSNLDRNKMRTVNYNYAQTLANNVILVS